MRDAGAHKACKLMGILRKNGLKARFKQHSVLETQKNSVCELKNCFITVSTTQIQI